MTKQPQQMDDRELLLFILAQLQATNELLAKLAYNMQRVQEQT
jgi:hypothetical protein